MCNTDVHVQNGGLGGGGLAGRAQAISSLKDFGDQRCLPALFEALRDPNTAISEAAESTVWEMFCQSGDPQVAAVAPLPSSCHPHTLSRTHGDAERQDTPRVLSVAYRSITWSAVGSTRFTQHR
jgi:hypothetical protein